MSQIHKVSDLYFIVYIAEDARLYLSKKWMKVLKDAYSIYYYYIIAFI